MNILKTLTLSLLFSSCLNTEHDEKSNLLISPSKKYAIKFYISGPSGSDNNHGLVYAQLLDSKLNFITEITTGAGDFNKWAGGWSSENDTLIVKSSDVGNYAWKISDNRLKRINMNAELNKRAELIFRAKYSK